MNYKQREAWILERHLFWCERIEQHGLRSHGEHFESGLRSQRPDVALDSNLRSWAGQFHRRAKTCTYAVLYAFKLGNAYDETIAHEVCHAYQRYYLRGCKSHGDMFFYLLRVVCGFDGAKRTHADWDRGVLTAIKLSYDIVKLKGSE